MEESPRACVAPRSGTGASRVPVVLPLLGTAGLASQPDAVQVCQVLQRKSTCEGGSDAFTRLLGNVTSRCRPGWGAGRTTEVQVRRRWAWPRVLVRIGQSRHQL